MKRFTDTEKWSDPWFRKLSPKLKLFWIFLCDRCDAAGVWKLDFESATFHVGESVNEKEALEALGHRIEIIPGDRWMIKKFIPFQYGVLSQKCRPHEKILALAASYRISLENGVYTLSDRVSDTLAQTLQEKTRQEEEEEGGCGGNEVARKTSEIPTEDEAMTQADLLCIPEAFARMVYSKWYERDGKDGSNIPVEWRRHVKGRWDREGQSWRNGSHKGKPKQESQYRTDLET